MSSYRFDRRAGAGRRLTMTTSGCTILPTTAEAGLSGVEATVWNGFLYPKGTPREIVTKMNKALNEMIERHGIVLPRGRERGRRQARELEETEKPTPA